MTVFGFAVSLMVLTLVFALMSIIALIIRKTAMSGREGLMYPVWIVILAISVLPLRISLPTGEATEIAYTRSEVLAEQNIESSTDIISETNTLQALPKTTAEAQVKHTDDFFYTLRRFMASGVGYLSSIAQIFVAVWLLGGLICLALTIFKYTYSKRMMQANSAVCDNARISAVLSELRTKMHIRRHVKLRIFSEETFMSPCICGFIFPTLYIEPGCLELSRSELECILTHELTHMRRFDMITKLFCFFATSVHWFNPISRKVRLAVLEDCELSCDYSVVRSFGSGASSMYMGTILDFTERYSKHCKLVFKDGMSCGLFASEPSGAAFMKMRYSNMKNYKGSRLAATLACIFFAVCVCINALSLSCSSAITVDTFGGAIKLSPAFDIMIRAYYGLDSDDYITPEMVDGITSIKVSTSTDYTNRTLLEFTVNSDSRITRPLPQISLANYTENLILAAMLQHGENHPSTDTDGNSVYDLTHYKHFKAYYVLAESTDISYVGTDVGCYVLDTESSRRELDYLHKLLEEVGLLDAWTVDSTELDVSSLGFFKNLRRIEFVGLTPIGYEFPTDVAVVFGDPGSPGFQQLELPGTGIAMMN